METVGKLFGIKPPTPADTSAQAAEIQAQNAAATLEKSKLQADQELADQQAELTVGARGKRGLLSYLSDNRALTSKLG